jgi:hypothetical protein
MAKSSDHQRQWLPNRALIGLLPASHPDWIATVTFCTALHAVDCLLAQEKISVTSLGARHEVLTRTNRYKQIAKCFLPLYSLSRAVRYLLEPDAWIEFGDIQERVL